MCSSCLRFKFFWISKISLMIYDRDMNWILTLKGFNRLWMGRQGYENWQDGEFIEVELILNLVWNGQFTPSIHQGGFYV